MFHIKLLLVLMKKLTIGDKMNILFIGRKIDMSNGGGIVTQQNLEILKSCENIMQVNELFLKPQSNFIKLLNIITNKPLGFSKDILKKIDLHIVQNNSSVVFIDHSLLGGFSKIISKKYKNTKIISFFHNVELDYYTDKLRIEGLLNLPMIYCAKKNERDISNFSDFVIALTKRDSDRLLLLYGITTNLLLPITLKDTFYSLNTTVPEKNYHLFVGSAFFANIEGICWYIENVLSEIDSLLVIIGKNMDFLEKKYINMKNLKVLGYVENLDAYYVNANFVINPVFSGSGMKTKTIEALKYGKTIIGTTEAFVGIDHDMNNIGFTCTYSNDFSLTIKKVESNLDKYKSNQLSRKLFINKYSIQNSIEKLDKFIGEIYAK